MPIPISCPSCSAGFKVKDEYAGKRTKCPKCGEPIVIPTAFQAAETMLGSPIVKTDSAAPKPKPVDDAADSSRKPKRRREDNDDEDEKPRSKKRRDDDEDDQPRSKRRRRDEDDKPKKKSVLPLILGIVGGVLVLCGGGCAGVWFGLVEPAAKKQREENDRLAADLRRIEEERNRPPVVAPQPPPPPAETKILVSNVAKLQAGMELREVREILGNEVRAEQATLQAATEGLPDVTVRERWGVKLGAGHVVRWLNGQDSVLIALSGPPDLPGTVTVQGVLARFNGEPAETIRLAEGGTQPPKPKPVAPNAAVKPGPFAPVATLSASDLAKDHVKYVGKWVVVTGKTKTAVNPASSTSSGWENLVLIQQGTRIEFVGPESTTMPPVATGQEVEVWGRVEGLSELKDTVRVRQCLMQTGVLEVDAGSLMDAFLADEKAAGAKYRGKTVRVTGTLQVKSTTRTIQATEPRKDGVYVEAGFALADQDLDLREGDRVVVLTPSVSFYKDEASGLKMVDLGPARLVSYSR